MKKRLSIITGMLMVIMLMAAPAWAATTDPATVEGDITAVYDVAEEGALVTAFDSITAADYVIGYEDAVGSQSGLTMTANTKWKVTVSADTCWTGTNSARTDKLAADLQLNVNTLVQGTDSGGIPTAVSGGFVVGTFSGLAANTAEKGVCENANNGNNEATGKVDYRMLLDAKLDKPGTYLLMLTYTIGAP